jgi:hypothetical protein
MNFVKCSGCGEQIAVPAELYPEPINGEIPLDEPYYCDACDREAENAVAASMGDDYDGLGWEESTCSHCGKDIYDWSDLGCGYCDRRHPDFGMLP